MKTFTKDEFDEIYRRRSLDDLEMLLTLLADGETVKVKAGAGQPDPYWVDDPGPLDEEEAKEEVRVDDAALGSGDEPIDEDIAVNELGLSQDAGLIGEVVDSNAGGTGVFDQERVNDPTETVVVKDDPSAFKPAPENSPKTVAKRRT